MHRFFVPAAWLHNPEAVRLEEPLAHQLVHVLRLQPGDEITLLDGSGRAFRCEISTPSATGPGRARSLTARVIEQSDPQTEPRTRLVLGQALLAEKKWDWVLQKGTELGVSTFAPLITARSLVRGDAVDAAKLQRWQRIVTEAAEQSGRARLPEILAPMTLAEACLRVPTDGRALLAWVNPETLPLRQALQSLPADCREMHLFIGPEGDFTPEEAALAQQNGALPISLGRRILRTETAALASLAMVLFALGEMD